MKVCCPVVILSVNRPLLKKKRKGLFHFHGATATVLSKKCLLTHIYISIIPGTTSRTLTNSICTPGYISASDALAISFFAKPVAVADFIPSAEITARALTSGVRADEVLTPTTRLSSLIKEVAFALRNSFAPASMARRANSLSNNSLRTRYPPHPVSSISSLTAPEKGSRIIHLETF